MIRKDISVIIPLHNSANFIKNIYENLNSQDFKNFDVIFINDHSQDNTVNELKETFSSFSHSWTILNSVKHGVSAARNLGIKNAEGKYIAFIDDDDKIIPSYLSILYQNAVEKNVDLVLGNYIEIFKEKKVLKNLPCEGVYNHKKIVKNILPQTLFPINNEEEIWLPVWRTLIKKELIINNEIFFDEKISQAEDFLFMLKTLLIAKKIYLLSAHEGIYFYRRRSNSSMNKYSTYALQERLYFQKKLVSILNENGLYKIFKNRYLSNRVQMYSALISNSIRANNKKISFVEIKKIRNAVFEDKYLKEENIASLYNPWFIKVGLIMLQHNQIHMLYYIYYFKEKIRLSRLR